MLLNVARNLIYLPWKADLSPPLQGRFAPRVPACGISPSEFQPSRDAPVKPAVTACNNLREKNEFRHRYRRLRLIILYSQFFSVAQSTAIRLTIRYVGLVLGVFPAAGLTLAGSQSYDEAATRSRHQYLTQTHFGLSNLPAPKVPTRSRERPIRAQYHEGVTPCGSSQVGGEASPCA